MNSCLKSFKQGSYIHSVNGFNFYLAKKHVKVIKKRKHSYEKELVQFTAFLDESLGSINVSEMYGRLKEIKNIKHILARILEARALLQMNNSAYAERILSEIMTFDFHYHLLTSEQLILSDSEKDKVFIRNLVFIRNSIEDKKIFENLIYYLKKNIYGKYRSQLDKHFSVQDNFSYVKTQAKSIKYGYNFPFLWGVEIYKKSSYLEFMKFMKNTEIVSKSKGKRLQNLYFYRFIKQILPANKEDVLTAALEASEKKGYYRELFLELFENDIFSQFYKKNTEKKVGFIASEKRKNYYYFLKKVQSYKYGAIKLLQIGDENSFIFYDLLNEKKL